MFCTLHSSELNEGITLELESGKQWVPREQFQPNAKGGKDGKGSKGGKEKKGSKGGKGKKTNAFTVKVKDVGSDKVREAGCWGTAAVGGCEGIDVLRTTGHTRSA